MINVRVFRRWVINTMIFVLMFIVGCVEPYLPEIIVRDHNYLTVDGFLVGNDSTFIKLSRTQLISDATIFDPELHAFVEVEEEAGTRYVLKEMKNGLYVAPPLDLNPAAKYRLHIRTDDNHEYRSDYVSLIPSPSLDSVTWKEDLQKDAIRFNVFAHDPANKTDYFLWTFDETWKYVSIAPSIYYFENGQILPRVSSTLFYYCWKTNQTNNVYLHSIKDLAEDVVYDFELFSIPQWSRKLYFGYSILVKQYALTREAFEYWTLTKKNSESLGGLFDPMPSQALSNIYSINNPEEPVIGYFSFTTVEKKRVFFNRQQVNGPTTRAYDATGYESCISHIVPLAEISASAFRGQLIYDRYYDPITFELVGYIVLPEECLDCRFKGGVTTMPDYWR